MIGTVTVVNKHHYKGKPLPDGAIFIGRPSIFGNPFSHMENTVAQYKVSGRDEAVACYAKWLANSMDAASIRDQVRSLADRVSSGEDLFLVCFCSPLKCHGDIIAHHIKRLAKESTTGDSNE